MHVITVTHYLPASDVGPREVDWYCDLLGCTDPHEGGVEAALDELIQRNTRKA